MAANGALEPITNRLRQIVAETLELDLSGATDDIPLFAFQDGLTDKGLGLDSLDALTLLTAVSDEFGLEPWWLDGSEEAPPATIGELAALVHAEVMRKERPSHA